MVPVVCNSFAAFYDRRDHVGDGVFKEELEALAAWETAFVEIRHLRPRKKNREMRDCKVRLTEAGKELKARLV